MQSKTKRCTDCRFWKLLPSWTEGKYIKPYSSITFRSFYLSFSYLCRCFNTFRAGFIAHQRCCWASNMTLLLICGAWAVYWWRCTPGNLCSAGRMRYRRVPFANVIILCPLLRWIRCARWLRCLVFLLYTS